MASKKRYFNEHVQISALGMKDDYGDYVNNQISFSPEGMAGCPRDVKFVDVPVKVTGFNRNVPGGVETSEMVEGVLWRLK